MHSGVEDLFVGMDVSENFAVGAVAVNSRAAVAMYVADAKDTQTATQAATAAGKVSEAALQAVKIKDKDVISKTKAIEDYVAPNGNFDSSKLKAITKETNAENDVTSLDSLDKFKVYLNKNPFDIDDLFNNIPKP
jgi:hypothetical protein